jgi:hypothetical protein
MSRQRKGTKGRDTLCSRIRCATPGAACSLSPLHPVHPASPCSVVGRGLCLRDEPDWMAAGDVGEICRSHSARDPCCSLSYRYHYSPHSFPSAVRPDLTAPFLHPGSHGIHAGQPGRANSYAISLVRSWFFPRATNPLYPSLSPDSMIAIT